MSLATRRGILSFAGQLRGCWKSGEYVGVGGPVTELGLEAYLGVGGTSWGMQFVGYGALLNNGTD